MPQSLTIAARYTLIAILAAIVLWRGIVPAFTRVDTDFPNYYTSARLVLEGRDMSRLYDDGWFRHQASAFGMNVEARFSPFPPPTALIMLPIAWLSPETALKIWTIINIFGLLAIARLLQQHTGKSLTWIWLLILFSGSALINNFRFGQSYIMLAVLIVLGYHCWVRQAPVAAGVLLGIGAAFKYFPLAYVPLMLLRREWKAPLACLLTMAAINGLTIGLLGSDIYGDFYENVFWNHLSAYMQDPFSSAFQSWHSLFRRWFVADAALNPSPLFPWPAGFVMLTSLVITTVVFVAARRIYDLQKTDHPDVVRLQFAIVTIAGLAVLPASATYHYMLLILPVALLLSAAVQPASWVILSTAAAYAIIGYIPYRVFRRFDGQGLLTIFAYPRLWMVTAMFTLTIIYVRQVHPLLVQSANVRKNLI